ncbi:MAG: class I SAM-dependent methyltransferase, partial [Dongiales bacterium]
MSRLDSMIRRLMIQRASLDWAMAQVAGLKGPVLEFGLGNGRSYDHLREHLPNRDIFVFDRHVAAHPDCIPPADRMILGDFKETAPAAAQRFAGQVA